MTCCWTTGSARVARVPILIVLDHSSIDSTHSNQTNLLMTQSGPSSPRMEKIPYWFHQHQPRSLRILEISYQMHPIATPLPDASNCSSTLPLVRDLFSYFVSYHAPLSQAMNSSPPGTSPKRGLEGKRMCRVVWQQRQVQVRKYFKHSEISTKISSIIMYVRV